MSSGPTALPKRRSKWKGCSTNKQSIPEQHLQQITTWERIEGEDVLNEHVLQTHRLCQSLRLLGQGTSEGFVDHEFPSGTQSIDGMEAPEAKKGQEAVIELLTAAGSNGVLDEDEAEPPRDAPRCFCHKRARLNRVRVPAAAVFRRPYYRCAGRGCRFIAMAECSPSVRAYEVEWVRFRTGSDRLVVVGDDGYRPEDARCGPETERYGASFVDALAVLAERPHLIDRLLPNACGNRDGSNGCHEVRICVEGSWKSVIVDEAFPIKSTQFGRSSGSTSSGRGLFPDRQLIFSRSAGNQLWLPLIEKAYAKSFGAYDFAFPGVSLCEVLADLTGAPVQGRDLPEARDCDMGSFADDLWNWLRTLIDANVLTACSARRHVQAVGGTAVGGCIPVHAVLGLADRGDPQLLPIGLGSQRAVRLRNPRTGFHAAATHHDALAALHGIPAERSTHGDGSFWVEFPHDFLNKFKRIDTCCAAPAGGYLAHHRSLRGEFTPDKGLGVRGCALKLRACAEVAANCTRVRCTLVLAQPLPRGAKLLWPAIGRVLNDLGILVLGANGEVVTLALGGALRDMHCQLELEPTKEYVVLPFSLRAWASNVTLRIHAAEPVEIQNVESVDLARLGWNGLVSAAVSPSLTQKATCTEHNLFLQNDHTGHVIAQDRPGDVAKLIVVELEGAAFAVIHNPHRDKALLVECRLEASHMAVHTSRGVQFGVWLRERNEAEALHMDARRPSEHDWRRYAVEDVVPPRSAQMFCYMFSVTHLDWKFDISCLKASEMPKEIVTLRPSEHPFASHCFNELFTKDVHELDQFEYGMGDGEALKLAMELSLAEAQHAHNAMVPSAHDQGNSVSTKHCIESDDNKASTQGRWARRTRQQYCKICNEAVVDFAPLECCTAQVCAECARYWFHVQVRENGFGMEELKCPLCLQCIDERVLIGFLDRSLLALGRSKAREQKDLQKEPPLLEELGLDSKLLDFFQTKRCPACGTGVQKVSESCHKMVCRTCRAKFCFRCSLRLEYFNCGCTGAEHSFVDPVTGELLPHQG